MNDDGTFELPRTTYRLVFDEPEYEGLVIKVRSSSLDELFQLDTAQAAIAEASGVDAVREAIRHRNALFVDKVTEWNLVSDGDPVPRTVDALCAFEAPFANRLFNAWRLAVSGVMPAPLDDGSTSGDEVESALMAIPSESLAS